MKCAVNDIQIHPLCLREHRETFQQLEQSIIIGHFRQPRPPGTHLQTKDSYSGKILTKKFIGAISDPFIKKHLKFIGTFGN